MSARDVNRLGLSGREGGGEGAKTNLFNPCRGGKIREGLESNLANLGGEKMLGGGREVVPNGS